MAARRRTASDPERLLARAEAMERENEREREQIVRDDGITTTIATLDNRGTVQRIVSETADPAAAMERARAQNRESSLIAEARRAREAREEQLSVHQRIVDLVGKIWVALGGDVDDIPFGDVELAEQALKLALDRGPKPAPLPNETSEGDVAVSRLSGIEFDEDET